MANPGCCTLILLRLKNTLKFWLKSIMLKPRMSCSTWPTDPIKWAGCVSSTIGEVCGALIQKAFTTNRPPECDLSASILLSNYGTHTLVRIWPTKPSKSAALDLVSSLRYASPTIWHVSANVSDRYQRQLNSKVKVMTQNRKTGRWEQFWKDLHTEDHLLDAECGVAIQAVILGLVSVPQEKIDVAA